MLSWRRPRCCLLSAIRLSICSLRRLYSALAWAVDILAWCLSTSSSYSPRTTILPALAFLVHSFCLGQAWQNSPLQRYCRCFSSPSPRRFVCVLTYLSSLPCGQMYACLPSSHLNSLLPICFRPFLAAFLSL